ncbi:MAG: pyruvate ferredoxin oxidoreductase [Candidatus Altarchaeum sp. CG2_30_32_3053]|nr:MAG: pyruvate ferredoxin oxidoreductase [Candidatus Altarchaeum sp. CG2_30_32_3053]
MINVLFFGRGGQGAVTASELLAKAAFKDNKFAQAFPSFGVERRGAPVQAFCKIDTQFIRSREQIYDPDYVVVFDPSLMDQVNVHKGLKIIVNSEKDYNMKNFFRVNATKIAIETLGVPIVNTSMLGAFCATKEVSLDSMKDAIKDKFGKRAEKNLIAAEKAYNDLKDKI